MGGRAGGYTTLTGWPCGRVHYADGVATYVHREGGTTVHREGGTTVHREREGGGLEATVHRVLEGCTRPYGPICTHRVLYTAIWPYMDPF